MGRLGARAVRGVPVPTRARYEARLADGIASRSTSACMRAAPTRCRWRSAFTPTSRSRASPRERWQVELPAMRRLASTITRSRSDPTGVRPAQRFRLAEREVRRRASTQCPRPPLRRGGRRPSRRGRVPRGLPCAQVFAPRNATLHLLRADGRAAERAAQRRRLRMLAPGERARASFSSSGSETCQPQATPERATDGGAARRGADGSPLHTVASPNGVMRSPARMREGRP